MNPHELILLSPYRYPAQHLMTLAEEDMASWLSAYSALWHPALLWQASAPPRCESQYDHEQPHPGCIYALPESPPLYLPDDWREKVQAVGSITFQATPDRQATLANLQAALNADNAAAMGWKNCQLSNDDLGYFFGVGLGYLLHASLVEAMEHENLLDGAGFWDNVQQAIAGFAADRSRVRQNAGEASETEDALPRSGERGYGDWLDHLRHAAEKLLTSREVMYPVTIHLLDLLLLSDARLADPWPASLTTGNVLNILASGAQLEKLSREQPAKLKMLRESIQADQAEICGGLYQEREDILLPVDSQLWNLQKGRETAKKLLDADIRVFARKRFGFHSQLPLLLTSSGITHCLLLAYDENSGLPTYTGVTISWPSPDGKTLEAFVRNPHPVDNPQTFFNLGHYWFKTTREDQAATIALVHKDKPPAVWYGDLMRLAQLAPLLGKWTTFSKYFGEVTSGEYVPSLSPDDFHFDYLSERTEAHLPGPISDFARHVRLRRRLDACWTLAGLQRSLAGAADTLNVSAELQSIEDLVEKSAPEGPESLAELESLEKKIAGTLADRLQSRATTNQPGYMVLNPCGFARRLALELEPAARPLAIEGPVKACQLDGNLLRVVVEVPALGFAWIPREGPPGTTSPPQRLRLADQPSLTLRNEFFEVEIDPQTGGLKAIRDHKSRVNRLGQKLVFHPGSEMKIRESRVTSAGPALGEIITEGSLVDPHQQVLANFRQRFRVWLGRPVLEMRIELEPTNAPTGYPWFAYYGSRFAWRDERGILLRSAAGTGYVTAHPRPQTPDYLELRLGRFGTVIYPGGLPFHQRHEGRMLDVILVPEGEKAHTFDLAIALDREQPIQTAQGLVTPSIVVPTEKGPPHIGASGWLFHLDSPHLLLSRLQPGAVEVRTDGDARPEPRDVVTARFLECGGHSGQAEFRCVRNPRRAAVLNARGDFLLEASVNGDAVGLEVTPNDLAQVQIEFS